MYALFEESSTLAPLRTTDSSRQREVRVSATHRHVEGKAVATLPVRSPSTSPLLQPSIYHNFSVLRLTIDTSFLIVVADISIQFRFPSQLRKGKLQFI